MSHERDIRPMIQNDDLLGEELVIDHIQGTDRINHLFEYKILAHRNDGVQIIPDDLMLKPSSLVLLDPTGEELHRTFGMFVGVRDLTEPSAQNPRIELTFVPRAYSSKMRETLDIFMEQTVPEIIEECLQRCGLESGEHYDIGGLVTEYETKEFVVQYKETDYAFISRLCEQYGIFFFVDHNSGKDVLTFGDDNAAFPALDRTPEIPFRPMQNSGGAFMDRVGTVDIITVPLPKRYTVRDYNYRIPGVDLLASADVDAEGGIGEIVEYGAHFKGPNEGQWIADIRAQQLISTKIRWHGAATAPSMQAGQRFTLNEHPMGDTALVLVNVNYSWPPLADDDDGSNHGFGTSFEAILADMAYRPPRVTPKPHVGSLTGIIQAGADDGYAELDDDGRYKVKFYFDTAERGEAQASRFVRMMQPHAGGGYGMHFPLRPGIEVLLTCVDGDPDRPIISGCVPNPETGSPVTAGNRDRNVIKTGGGNMIDISDEDGRQRFKFTTPTEGSVFQLGADNEAELGAVIKSSANVTAHGAETLSNGAQFVSEISDFSWKAAGSNITSVAGIPSPISGFEKIEKLVSSANKAVGSVNALCDGVANFDKEMQDSHVAQAKASQKSTEDAVLARAGKKYPDDARTTTVGTPPNEVQVVETEAQFRARIVAESGTDEEKATIASASSSAGVTQHNPGGLGPLDPGLSDRWKNSTANKVMDGVGDALGGVAKVMAAAKPLFSEMNKAAQKVIDKAQYVAAVASAGRAVAAVAASTPRKSAVVRTPGENYNLMTATDSVVFHGIQAAYLLSPAQTHVASGSRATLSAKSSVGMYSPNTSEIASKKHWVTTQLSYNMQSKGTSTMISDKDMLFKTKTKMRVIADDDLRIQTKKKLFSKAVDLYDLDAGKKADLKADEWKLESRTGKVDVVVKGDWSAAIEGGITWEHNKKGRFYAKGDTVLMRHNSGGNFTAKNNHARMSMKGGASLKIEAAAATLDGKGSVTIKGSTIKANGKCLLG